MRRWLPEILALPLLPLLIVQGKRTRRVTPRLPDAHGPTQGIAGKAYGATPLSLLAFGESPVAGVGVGTHEEAISGQLALALSSRLQRPIAWQAIGKNGATAREALAHLLPQVARRQTDIVLLAFGVNDTTAFRSVAQWRDDMHALIAGLQDRCAPRMLLLAGVPPLRHFPALPRPLRWVMGLKADVLDLALRDMASTLDNGIHVPVALDASDRALMARDGYHPSVKGCEVWAQMLGERATARLSTMAFP